MGLAGTLSLASSAMGFALPFQLPYQLPLLPAEPLGVLFSASTLFLGISTGALVEEGDEAIGGVSVFCDVASGALGVSAGLGVEGPGPAACSSVVLASSFGRAFFRGPMER
jgi:hypothetical protein